MSTLQKSIIVAMSKNNCIGKDGDLPWHIPGDLKRVKKITMGKPLIMGRATHESVCAPRDGHPLSGRVHFVVSRSMEEPGIDGVFVYRDLNEAIEAATKYAQTQGLDEIIIFGGAQIYQQTLPYTDKIYLTEVDTSIEDGDAFFPEIDMSQWNEYDSNMVTTEEGLNYTISTLTRR